MPRGRCTRHIPTVLAAALCLCARPAAAWQVLVDRADLSGAAAPQERGSTVMANLATLGPALNVAVQSIGREATITDRRGGTWLARDGALALEGRGRALPLPFPVECRGSAVYLPVSTVAELAAMEVKVDRQSGVIAFLTEPSPTADAPEGWQPIAIEKPAGERRGPAAEDRDAHPAPGGAPQYRAAPTHENMNIGFGLGYVQDADFGMEITGTGSILGAQVNADGLLTYGPLGMRPYSGRVMVQHPNSGWGVEAVDLFSDVWGLRRGARYSWRWGKERRPSLGIYLPESRLPGSKTVLAYRDDTPLTRNLRLAGEVASEGSFLLRSTYQSSRLYLLGYGRGGIQRGVGVLGNYTFPRGVNFHAGLTQSGSGTSRVVVRNVGIRFPLWRQVDLTLDQTVTRLQSGSTTAYDALLGFLVGPMRLMAGYRLTSHAFGPALGVGFASESKNQEWSAGLGYSPMSRLQLDYQVRLQQSASDPNRLWEQLVASYQVTPRTQLQTISGFPHLIDPLQFRVRLEHQLRNDIALSLDYGPLMPYQSAAWNDPGRGFSLMVRKQFDVATPAGGGAVKGRVSDQAGRPVQGVAVQWNGYTSVTDSEGRYSLDNVSPGLCRIALDPSSVPADYRAADTERRVKVGSRRVSQADFRLIPLNTVTGIAFWDKNGNSRCDPGEGVQGAAVMLGSAATATGADGTFAFYNVEPGRHTARLVANRLPEGMCPIGKDEAQVELVPGKPAAGILFQVMRKEKPIQFEVIP